MTNKFKLVRGHIDTIMNDSLLDPVHLFVYQNTSVYVLGRLRGVVDRTAYRNVKNAVNSSLRKGYESSNG